MKAVSAQGSEPYIITYSAEHQRKLHSIINPRRGPTQSVPGLDMPTGLRLGDEMFKKFSLGEYAGCVTAESLRRPVPHVFATSITKPLTDLYLEWAPYIFKRIIREMKPPIQTYNKVSRLGWPDFTNPDNKATVLFNHFANILESGLRDYQHSFIIVNVRLQAEPRTKKREFVYVDDSGKVYHQDTSLSSRAVEVHDLGTRTASRTRLIFNMPIPNLLKQVFDTAVHNVFLQYPAFHHDMFNGKILPVQGYHVCLDVKHFERYTADAVRARGINIIKGLYGDIARLFADIPFAVPSDSYDEVFYLRPNRNEGWADQFSSGDSAVAPAQKEIFTALYGEYFRRTRGLGYEEAINLVFRGGDEKLTIRNYGDDNSLSGDKVELDEVQSHLAKYLEVEMETPPKFLGHVWYDDLGWKLPPSSYLLKTYLNERRPHSNFRRYPYLGWALKREIFSKQGHPSIARDIYPYEDVVLAKAGLPWTEIAWRADKERLASMGSPAITNANWILGKDWAMDAEEKMRTGEFIGMYPNQTAPILKQLVGEEWRELLSW